MKPLIAGLRAELVKLRKSWPLLISILSPVCMVGFILVLFWFSDAVVIRFRPGYRFWLDLNFTAWNLIVLPVIAAVVTEMSWEQDKDAVAWRHILHQPIPTINFYLAKLLSNYMLFWGCILIMFLLLPLGGKILEKNEALPMGSLDVKLMFQYLIFTLSASIPIVTFHTWFSFRFSGSGPGLGFAILGTWGTMKLIGITDLIQLLPWGLSSHSSIIFERWKILPWNYCFGALAVTILFVYVGSIDFSKHAFEKSLERK
ncbi:MAG: ABC transporter permease [Holophagaceae bacterium]|nr:ABC transporter permease [Holophagaceae bacterium]